MPYVVTQPCCADASCVTACPVNCIHPAPGEPGFATTEMVFIDAATCVGCGACVTACPVGAIVPDHALRPDQRPFVELAAEYYDVFPHADRTPVALVPPPRRPVARDLRVAVVGAGPAGLHTADELLRHPGVGVDVYDRRREPHGLARYGVAPDHVDTRGIARLFEVIAAQPGFRYRLGVEVRSRADLPEAYDAVVWATGASADRALGVPGDEGVLGATTLARWANGDPEVALALPAVERAVVVGAGNVALDTARLLVGPRVGATEVSVLGRRGVEHAALTTPELVGLAGLEGVDVLLRSAPPEGRGVRERLLTDLAARRPTGRPRIVLRFDAPVTAVLPSGVRLADGEELAADLVVGAVGHEHQPVAHERGRLRPGEYVAGWAKRGPRGFLGTTRADAQESVATLLDDVEAGRLSPSRPHRPRASASSS
ncbi:FAD-dependent oxidoreductase [Nocardioides anomalus]|uniref:ferredoxin--NADP(+) reductase n=1 Tax=Nocardioides anomalus TaxID=2712223 RepID=A0A6G6WEA0_9ACTN|nr:FAD-dependent oxidoreductase [Nocardioides anomalus]QIG43539.1 FAD-dependent oxidoreductase [Nocardioides anomalus]